jgi:hypothetical protein
MAQSLIDEDWQYINHQSGDIELYSMRGPKGHTLNLADSAAYVKVIQGFQQELKTLPARRGQETAVAADH